MAISGRQYARASFYRGPAPGKFGSLGDLKFFEYLPLYGHTRWRSFCISGVPWCSVVFRTRRTQCFCLPMFSAFQIGPCAHPLSLVSALMCAAERVGFSATMCVGENVWYCVTETSNPGTSPSSLPNCQTRNGHPGGWPLLLQPKTLEPRLQYCPCLLPYFTTMVEAEVSLERPRNARKRKSMLHCHGDVHVPGSRYKDRSRLQIGVGHATRERSNAPCTNCRQAGGSSECEYPNRVRRIKVQQR